MWTDFWKMHVIFYPTEITLQVAVLSRLEGPASSLRYSWALGTNLFKIVSCSLSTKNSPRGDDKQDPDPAGQAGAEFPLISVEFGEGTEMRDKPLCEIICIFLPLSRM